MELLAKFMYMQDKKKRKTELIENLDYYLENGVFVFTEFYHLERGYCCESGCRHCPYSFNLQKKTKNS